MKPSMLKSYFLAQHTCVRLVTNEEDEAVSNLLDVARELNLTPYIWSVVQGAREATLHTSNAVPGTENAAAALVHWRMNIRKPSMCICLDMIEHMSEPRVVRAWRELNKFFRIGGENMELYGRAHIVMVDHREDAPPVISVNSVRHFAQPPDDAELEEILKQTLRSQHQRGGITIDIKRRNLDAILQNLRGLTRRQAKQLVVDTVAQDRTLNVEDLAVIIEGKRKMLSGAGVLEFVDSPSSIDAIGGLKRLKKWLSERELSLDADAKEFGLSPPRGVLLLGVQGAGKSLAAKAIATAWKRPLLKLDPGTLYDRYVGESEKRLRDALAQAEAMSPVVLWIDEIEKGFASAASTSTDGGLSRRMFGTLLNWMQEHTAPVFLVATANDIEALPPELLRKGRFDEIFFVDLPTHEARVAILAIHLKKRKQDPKAFDLAKIADAIDGYSGAEIEQGIMSALHQVFSRRKLGNTVEASKEKLTTELLIETLRASPPLVVTMKRKIEALRQWSVGKCVPADE